MEDIVDLTGNSVSCGYQSLSEVRHVISLSICYSQQKFFSIFKFCDKYKLLYLILILCYIFFRINVVYTFELFST